MADDDHDEDPDAPSDIGDIVDELPEDLDVTTIDGDYTIPNNNRRRIPAVLYLIMAAGVGFLWWEYADSSPLVNDGVGWAALAMALFGLYGLVAGWTLRVDESEALVSASRVAGFAVGHASAQMVWRGWLSRPVWRVLVYSAENPPAERAFALVDGVDGSVIEWFREDNPERWSGESDAAPPASASPTVQ